MPVGKAPATVGGTRALHNVRPAMSRPTTADVVAATITDGWVAIATRTAATGTVHRSASLVRSYAVSESLATIIDDPATVIPCTGFGATGLHRVWPCGVVSTWTSRPVRTTVNGPATIASSIHIAGSGGAGGIEPGLGPPGPPGPTGPPGPPGAAPNAGGPSMPSSSGWYCRCHGELPVGRYKATVVE